MTPTELALNLDLPKRAVALVLAGGRGSRLMSLTDQEVVAAYRHLLQLAGTGGA